MTKLFLGLTVAFWCLLTAQAGANQFDQTQCPFKLPMGYTLEQNARCGFISVPENRLGQSDQRIQLAVLVLQNTVRRTRDATVFLQGGPGAGTQGTVTASSQGILKALRADSDLIFFDQRGTGLSQPSLMCEEVARVRAVQSDTATTLDPVYLWAYAACKRRLEASGINIQAYNSSQNAADVNAIREALGYERLNLYGGSYGSLLAQRVMRDAPQIVRSVILDAVVDPTQPWIASADTNQINAFSRLSAACRTDERCARAIPDLMAALLQLMRTVDAERPVVRIDGTFRDVTLNAETVLGAFNSGLRSHLASLLPYVLRQALQGDYQNVARLSELAPRGRQDIAWGMYWSVACAEAVPFQPFVAALSPQSTFDAYLTSFSGASAALSVCQMWQVPTDWKALQPVRSDAPTLLLSGYFDPITPPDNAERVAITLTRARTVTFTTTGHGQLFNGTPCVLEIIGGFLSDPSVSPDSSCANEALKFPYL